jgi:hypothetical protein
MGATADPAPVPPAVDRLARLGHANQLEWFREMTRWSGRAGALDESDGVLLFATGTDFPVSCNGAARTDPGVPATEVLARADAWFAARGRGYMLTASDHRGVDDDLQAAAGAAGLALLGEPPEMVVDHPVAAPTVPDGVTLTWVDDAAGLAAFVAVCSDAYGVLGMPAGVVEAAITDVERFTAPWVHAVVARRADGTPVAAAQVLLSHGIAGVYWVGTVTGARGTGLGAAVTTAVTNRAFDDGATAVTLQASSQGESVYRRKGYRTLYRYHRWVRFEVPAEPPDRRSPQTRTDASGGRTTRHTRQG